MSSKSAYQLPAADKSQSFVPLGRLVSGPKGFDVLLDGNEWFSG